MNKVEAQIVKRPSIDPVTVANNANQALYKNCREWREYATALEEDVRNLSERVVELDSKSEEQQLEIPECVAEFIENYDDINETSLLYIMKDFVESKHWDVFCKIPDDLKKYGRWDDMLYKAIRFGYTVAKEKRFYLKHIDFCKRDKDYDWYMIKHSDGLLNHLRVEKETLPPTVDAYFTQQEIESMETGSYEQIEVEE